MTRVFVFKTLFSLLIITAVFSCFILHAYGQNVKEQQSDLVSDQQHLLYIDVEEVYIHVNYQVFGSFEIPEYLSRENIERLLFETYQKRFSSKACDTRGYNKYGCNDQKVILLDDHQYTGYRSQELKEKRHSKGALNVMFIISLRESMPHYDDPKLKEPLVMFTLLQERPDVDFLTEWNLVMPEFFPLLQSKESTLKRIEDHINRRIF